MTYQDHLERHNIEGPVHVAEIALPVEDAELIQPKNTNGFAFEKVPTIENRFRQTLITALKKEGKQDSGLIQALETDEPNYVFRCFTTKHRDHEEILKNLHRFGTDNDMSQYDKLWYKVGRMLAAWAYPGGSEVEDLTTVRSFIVIYKNDPSYFDQDKTHLWVGEKNRDDLKLKDLLIGAIEISWV